ncbi:MAG: replication initiator protein WhiP [Desulfurococcales archaeon]|nr:replication initiator protein WhiP [Desulfurococcales archaeon]
MVDDIINHIREQLKRQRGHTRGGPRSKLVDAIMVLLLSKPMRSAEIAGILGLDSRYVASYLSYWKTRGYVEYNSGFWFLTEKGEEYAQEVAERASDEKFDRLTLLAQRILASESINPTRKHKRKTISTVEEKDSLSFIAALKRKPENKLQERAQTAACVIDVLKNELDDDELELFTALLSHYTKWGNTYMYLDQIADLLKADYKWLLRTARSLQTKNLIYIYTDPKLGMRIGLSKQAKELLEECSF